jgi:pimeloyl-ACP methyl ester carboxylesterase
LQLEVITKTPEANTRPTPVLFVHGAWHGAWCWGEHFQPYFAQQGYESHALSLRGHGGSEGREGLRWTRLKDYVADVAHVVNSLQSPPVLVGHSMGGLIVRQYLESHAVPAAVLMASVPPKGALRATLRVACRHFLTFLKANLTLSLYPIIGTPSLTREAFFSQKMPEEQVAAYFARMQNESYCAFWGMLGSGLHKPKPPQTPVLVLGGAADAIFSPREVEETARAYETEAVIFPDMAHDQMLEAGWQAVADRIIGWLSEQGL